MRSKTVKIYDVEGWPNPLRVRCALAEKGALEDVEFIPVDVLGLEHRSAEFKQKNPDGLVPCLELEDGSYLSQCNAIIEYLDAAFDGPSLTGETPQQRGHISMMNLRAERGLLDAVSAYFHHATPGLGPQVETDQCAEWGKRQKEVALSGMRALNGVLANSTYLAGENFTIADITAYAGMVFAGFAKIVIPEDLHNLMAWKQRLKARPSLA